MRILWFFEKQLDVAPNSSARVEIIKHLQQNNKVYLVAGYRKNKIQFEELNDKIVYLKSTRIPVLNRFLNYVSQLRNFKSLILRYKPNILLFNTHNYFLLNKARKLKKKIGYRCFLDIRSLPVSSSRLKRIVSNYLFRNSLQIGSKYCDGVTYITEEMENYCRRQFDLHNHKSIVWNSGVNTTLFKPIDNINNKTFRLIYHGTLADNRGLDSVIEAINLLREYDIELFLLGSGNGLSDLKKLTREMKLEEKVLFHSSVSYKEVPNHINSADAGVLPFPHWTGWDTSSPIKLFEYLACCKPVIVTKIPAHINVLANNDFAFWAENSTPREISKAIRKAYESRSQFERLGLEAREFVTKDYSWARQAKKLEEFMSE